MNQHKPINRIGLFDSGIGGLTVLKDLLNLSIAEYIYIADSINMPYGQKTPEQILLFSSSITQFLLTQKIDAMVIACHTSSAIALPTLKKLFPQLPIIGTIHETMLHASQQTKNNRIGVIATQASINSHLHKKELLAINQNLEVFEVACPKLVPLIEAPTQDMQAIEDALHEYLSPLIAQDIDTLILGCTHYPLLEQEIKKIVGEEVSLISSGSIIAQSLKSNCDEKITTKKLFFFATNDVDGFEQKAQLILNQKFKAQHLILSSNTQRSVESESILSNTI